jgi:inosine-uridine nucleoside N-ribohydrolase
VSAALLLALAFAAASPELRIEAITTVAGNAPIDAVTDNVLRFCALAGLDVPVGKGAAAPLALESVDATHFHGPDGRRGIELPAPRQRALVSAGVLLRDSLESRRVDCVLALGPLTNLAALVETAPELFGDVRVIWMGGSLSGGNVTPVAEFNAYADPRAVDLVLGAGLRLDVIGLDVTAQVVLRETDVRQARLPGNLRGRFARAVLAGLIEAEVTVSGMRAAILHDPTAVAAALDDALFRWEPRCLAASVSEGAERGRLSDLPLVTATTRATRWASEVRRERIARSFVRRLSSWCTQEGP